NPGCHDALEVARDLGAFNPDTDPEYTRGIVELISGAFLRGNDDPGTGERTAFITQLGCSPCF
ncbi:hypothetical protein, partial [Nocardia cyriacigeorgica]|uniref:hypothetical protein n=1 Tax=Nocardia cyriacigeorgica TaxID=135487 RepID=UPI001E38067E